MSADCKPLLVEIDDDTRIFLVFKMWIGMNEVVCRILMLSLLRQLLTVDNYQLTAQVVDSSIVDSSTIWSTALALQRLGFASPFRPAFFAVNF